MERKSGSLVILLLLLIALPLFYVFSFGPVMAYAATRWDDAPTDTLAAVYLPLLATAEVSATTEDVLVWWLNVWTPLFEP